LLLKLKIVELRIKLTTVINLLRGMEVLLEIRFHLLEMLSIALSVGTFVKSDTTFKDAKNG